MKEIWKMWRMVCLLRDRRFEWGIDRLCDVMSDDFAKLIEKTSPKYVTKATYKEYILENMSDLISSFRGEPSWVERKMLVSAYVNTYYQKQLQAGLFRDCMAEAQSIIQSCIDDEREFIKVVDGQKSLIFLTRNGKSFAGYDGLLKAWLEEFDPITRFITGGSLGAIIVGGVWFYRDRLTEPNLRLTLLTFFSTPSDIPKQLLSRRLAELGTGEIS
jgi:hypothetical protein